MKTIHVHKMLIWNDNRRQHIYIKLPRNCKRLTAIKVTSAFTPHFGIKKKEVGWLWLRTPDKRDVFFAEILNTPCQQHDWASFDQLIGSDALLPNLNFGQGHAWIDGTTDETFSIEVDGENTIIEGYYNNRLPSKNLEFEYQVTIYLTLESHD